MVSQCMSYCWPVMKGITILLVVVATFLCVPQIQTISNGTSTCDGCLILTPYIKNGTAAEARQLSEVSPDEFLQIKSHSGFMTVQEVYSSNLFFWFFPAEKLADTPWIIWLQGGPGITSLKGLFDLIGPLKIENGKVKLRNVTWANDYSVLFLDNPVGAGFSFTEDDRGYTNNEDDVGGQMFEFLQQFLEMFPELQQAPLFISGESYAGKYVPALGVQIHRHRQNVAINLRGLTIGNGLIDPKTMMHYSDLCRAIGLLAIEEIDVVKELEETIVNLIHQQKIVDASNKFNETIEYIKKRSGVSMYNFIEDPSSKPSEFEAFVTRPEVRRLIHVGNATFDYNNQYVYQKMLPDIMNTTKPFLEELLDHYGVMSYSGQLDVMLAYSLSKHTYAELHWSGREKYAAAQRKRLRRFANGDVVAYKKSGGNFVEVLVRKAGHMVPADQPEVVKFLIDIFINEFK